LGTKQHLSLCEIDILLYHRSI